MTLEEGWSRGNARGQKHLHYYFNGRTLCRSFGTYPGIKLTQDRHPAQECPRCQKTFNRTVTADQRRTVL